MPAVTETRTHDALISTTLENWAKGVEDNITTSLFFYYMLKKSKSWIGVDALGERCKYPLRYENGVADSYSGYDVIPIVPMDGITAAFFNWVQMAVAVTISRIEERQNAGEYQMINLLEEKVNQAQDGIIELFAKAFLQGNGINTATAIATTYASPINGALFLEPLAKLVAQDPTAAGTVGSVNQVTNSWWRNQKSAATDTNYASFLKDLAKLRHDCMKGIGGAPDMHITDQATVEFYEAALRSFHHNMDYKRADIPFDNIAFHNRPVTWDEFMPNWSGGTTVQSTTQGTWVMLNSKFIQVKFDNQTNFITTPYQKPIDQDAKSSLILWYGAAGVTNRRKHGVLSDINTTLTS